jgi:predicted DCC family thiol-disulfide oxidoreductase YuxK
MKNNSLINEQNHSSSDGSDWSHEPEYGHATACSMQVFYNSACPVCDLGIRYQKSRINTTEGQADITWNDVHNDASSTDCLDASVEFIKERLHVVDAGGNLHVGIDAFIALWTLSPQDAWCVRVFSVPIIHGIAAVSYTLFARLLYCWNRYRRHW